jgi:hypothetical protein
MSGAVGFPSSVRLAVRELKTAVPASILSQVVFPVSPAVKIGLGIHQEVGSIDLGRLPGVLIFGPGGVAPDMVRRCAGQTDLGGCQILVNCKKRQVSLRETSFNVDRRDTAVVLIRRKRGGPTDAI